MRSNRIAFIIAIALIIISMFIGATYSDDDKKYTIETKYAIYHTDSFRIYGKGIVFDDNHNRQVIVMGDFDITSKLK